MRFIVPQFIDVEDKIIGPLSVRQFIELLLTAGLLYLEFKIFSLFVFILVGLTTFAIGVALAFVKINSQSLHFVGLNVLQTMQKPNLRTWRKTGKIQTMEEKVEIKKDSYVYVPKARVTTSRLRDLALMVDTGGVYKGDQQS